MTINVGLVTSDALVLGCDSIATVTAYFLDPFALTWNTDAAGKLIEDAEGKYSVQFDFRDLQPLVTNAWGGVTKMFEIHPAPTPVVAVTAGAAKLNDRPIASYGMEFFSSMQKREKKKFVKVDVICRQFLAYMRNEFERHYASSPLPDSLKEGPEFIVGGYGRDDDFPSIFRVSVKDNRISQEFSAGKTGISWNGQSDAVERFIRGYDSSLKHDFETKIAAELTAYSKTITNYVAETINKILDLLEQKLPDGVKIELPEIKKIETPWNKYNVSIDYANLPLQDAIELVSFLVNVQAGRAKFARGVATVGGRTHIGVITKAKGFQLLNEPQLAHRHTGFGDDLQ